MRQDIYMYSMVFKRTHLRATDNMHIRRIVNSCNIIACLPSLYNHIDRSTEVSQARLSSYCYTSLLYHQVPTYISTGGHSPTAIPSGKIDYQLHGIILSCNSLPNPQTCGREIRAT